MAQSPNQVSSGMGAGNNLPTNVDNGTPAIPNDMANTPRPIERNVRGQIISYEILGDVPYGDLAITPLGGTSTQVVRYLDSEVRNQIDTDITNLSFNYPIVQPEVIVRSKPDDPLNYAAAAFFGWSPNQPPPPNAQTGNVDTGITADDYSTTVVDNANSGNSGYGGTNINYGNFFGVPFGGSTGSGYGNKIICNELYRQGYLSEELWNADERYGDMMFESDPKLVIGYQMWARKVVKLMRKRPLYGKLAYKIFKPWTEYMGYKMGVIEKPTLMGRFTNWIGSKFSYMVFDLYNGQRLLDKYNQKVAV